MTKQIRKFLRNENKIVNLQTEKKGEPQYV